MLALALMLLTATIQNPPEQTPCPNYAPMSIDDVSFSPSSLKPNQSVQVEIEGENESDEVITLIGAVFYLQEGTNYLQDQFTLENTLSVSPGQEYKLIGQWTPAIQNWPNGSATLHTYLGDTTNTIVGCSVDGVNISGLALKLAAALLLSLHF
jgi:hypothetical protein